MKMNRLLPVLINAALPAVLFLLLRPSPVSARPALSDAFVFGAQGSYSARGGYWKLPGVREYLRADNSGVVMAGGMAGKRFALAHPRLRLQIAAECEWGSAADTGVRFGDTDIKLAERIDSEYVTGGIAADLHMLIPADGLTVFLSLGPGLYLTGYSVTRQDYGLPHGTTRAYLSPGASAGVGAERKIGSRLAVSAGYYFRIWQSVGYTPAVNGLFPMGADYEEFFFSHALRAQVLLLGKKHEGETQ